MLTAVWYYRLKSDGSLCRIEVEDRTVGSEVIKLAKKKHPKDEITNIQFVSVIHKKRIL